MSDPGPAGSTEAPPPGVAVPPPDAPAPVDAWIAALPPDRRAVMAALRDAVLAEAPEATQAVSYQLPAFKLHGRGLVAFGSAARHLALYPMSGTAIEAHRDALAGFDCSKGTIRFTVERPLPTELVRRLVRWRVAEEAAARPPRPRSARPSAAAPPAPGVDALRRAVREADASIVEGVKWNAPSFRTVEWFATVNLRARDGLELILHRGARRRPDPLGPGAVEDPEGLLRWLGPDRAVVRFEGPDALAARGAAFAELVRAWVRRL